MKASDATLKPTVRTMVSLVDRRTVLRLTGPAALDFLGRMSTNDISTLAEGEIRTTIFTNEKGKIIELADVCRSGDHLLLVGAKGEGGRLAAWLDRFIIMEKIVIENLSAKFLCIDTLETAGHTEPPASDGVRLCYKPDLWSGHLHRTLMDVGARHDSGHAPAMSRADSSDPAMLYPEGAKGMEFTLARLRLGIPSEEELTPDYNPLEACLERFVSFTKGCYIGQEVIARIDSYKKLQRKLFKIKVRDIAPEKLHLPTTVSCAGGTECGRITSIALDPRSGELLGLAYIELKHSKSELTSSCSCGKSHLLEVMI